MGMSLVLRPEAKESHFYSSSCSSADILCWRHQIKSTSAAGHGVFAPYLLDYSDTNKLADPASYGLSTMSLHMADILDIEEVKRCLTAGHDW